MNKQVFIRYEIPAGKSWMEAIASVNQKWTDWNDKFSSPNPSIEYDQKLEWYRRLYADYRLHMQFFKTVSEKPTSFLSLGIPLDLNDQSVTIAPVEMDFMIEKLDSGDYKEVFFAFHFASHPEGAGDLDVVTKSGYFARNTKTGKFENLKTGEVLKEDQEKFSIFYCVIKVGNSGFYYMVTNPELTSVLRDLDGTFNGVDYQFVDVHDGSFANAVFKPSVRTGGTLVSQNIIVADGDSVTIDVFGGSAINKFGFRTKFGFDPLPDDEIPRIELLVESNVPYTVNNHLIELKLDSKATAFVKFRWITGSALDYNFISDEESLTGSFVIIKQ